MVDAASDHAPAAAPAAPPASAKPAPAMQDGVVHTTDNATKTATTAHGSSPVQGSPLASQFSGMKKEVFHPTQQPANTKRSTAKPNTKDASLAHQAALHRVNARTTAPPSKSSPTTQSTTSSQPVLVNAAPKPANMKKRQNQQQELEPGHPHEYQDHQQSNHPANSNRKTKSTTTTTTLPTPENFSIQEILSSLGPEASSAIDAIAEICGRSKLSLADQHGSHMPPHGEVEALPIARMETLDESRRNGVQTRAMARRLAMAANRAGEAVSSDATAATSSVMSHAPPSQSGRRRGGGAATANTNSSSSSNSMLPLVLSWLRDMSSSASSSGGEGVGDAGGAAGTLHRLLTEDGQLRPY